MKDKKKRYSPIFNFLNKNANLLTKVRFGLHFVTELIILTYYEIVKALGYAIQIMQVKYLIMKNLTLVMINFHANLRYRGKDNQNSKNYLVNAPKSTMQIYVQKNRKQIDYSFYRIKNVNLLAVETGNSMMR